MRRLTYYPNFYSSTLKNRLTAEEALEHPYVSQFHNEDDEPVCSKTINITMDDNHKFSIREYREKLYSDIHKRKKELRKKILQSHHSYFSKYR